MAKYSTPSWSNNTAPAINASAMTAMGQGIELAQHPYGVCSSSYSSQQKLVTVDVSGTMTLFAGLVIRVKFEEANGNPSPTLNVNGTGHIPITRNGTLKAVSWRAGDIIEFIYDGTNWVTLASTGTSPVDIKTGTYLGTGEYGSLYYANRIQVDVRPMLFIVGKPGESGGLGIMGTGLTPAPGAAGWDSSFLWFTGQRYAAVATEDLQSVANVAVGAADGGNGRYSLWWYSDTDAHTQCNVSGVEYPYIIIGMRDL